MDYAAISKETITYLYKSHTSLKNSPIDLSILLLVELRVSQINGCAYCCAIHASEARKLNIPQEKLDQLPAWWTARESFTDKEKIALQWCEAITKLEKKELREIKKLLFEYYSEREIVDLTASISIMNALNRMAIGLR